MVEITWLKYLNHPFMQRNLQKTLRQMQGHTEFVSSFRIAQTLPSPQKDCHKTFYDTPAKFSNEDKRRAILMYLNNCGVRKTALFIGCSRTTITKSGESRTIPLNDAAFRVLVAYLRLNLPNKKVFWTKSFRGAWENALKRASIDQATFHDLRRTFATSLKDEGISLHTIQELLGHSSIMITEHYLTAKGPVLAEGVAKINFC